MDRRIVLLSLVLIMVVLISGCAKSNGETKPTASQSPPPKTPETLVSLPDLIITEVTWAPQNPKGTDIVKFDVKVKNSGSSDATSSKGQIFNGGLLIGDFDILDLKPGQEQSVEKDFAWIMSSGDNNIRILVDSNGQVAESNENNNQWDSTR